jgi:predicted lipoprotein with Yx(FWY)xxD motif
MKIYSLAAVAAASLLTLSACGSGSSSSSAGTQAQPSTTPASNAGGLHVATTSLGKVVVDGQGRTVYMLTADHGGHSSCSNACLQYWPPVAPGKASGLGAKVGATATTTGGQTATVGNWPVYTYVGDAKPGDVSGEGIANFGGVWYAVSPNGTPVKAGGSSSQSSSSGGRYAY